MSSYCPTYCPTSALRMMFVIAFACLVQACTVNVPLQQPAVSNTPYELADQRQALSVQLVDSLGEDHETSEGALPIKLKLDGASFSASPFVVDNLRNEIAARGLPLSYDESSPVQLSLQDFSILHHRVSGFSPMVTLSSMKVQLVNGEKTRNLSAFVKRGKVPVWSMSEINDPCYNEPIELLIKEMTAKINGELFGYRLDDETVSTLVAKIEGQGEGAEVSYFDVYELGFSNNPRAIEPLHRLIDHSGEYVRLAAISGLGILRAEQYLDELKSIYASERLWQERGMALKAIGDIGSEPALTFLRQENERWADQSSNEAVWNKRIISLFID